MFIDPFLLIAHGFQIFVLSNSSLFLFSRVPTNDLLWPLLSYHRQNLYERFYRDTRVPPPDTNHPGIRLLHSLRKGISQTLCPRVCHSRSTGTLLHIDVTPSPVKKGKDTMSHIIVTPFLGPPSSHREWPSSPTTPVLVELTVSGLTEQTSNTLCVISEGLLLNLLGVYILVLPHSTPSTRRLMGGRSRRVLCPIHHWRQNVWSRTYLRWRT